MVTKTKIRKSTGLEKAIHWQADRPDPGAGAGRGAGALRHRRSGLRQTPIEVDAVQLLWQGHHRTDHRRAYRGRIASDDAIRRRRLARRKA